MENSLLHPTVAGTPQGGNSSPIYANMALDGLEATIKLATKGLSKINIVRYADDFIVTANCSTLLENRVKPAIQSFLAQRGFPCPRRKPTLLISILALIFWGSISGNTKRNC
jgi:RNA-directed DNA polymerase